MTDRLYFAIAQHTWGKGETRAKAVKEMKARLPTCIPENGEFAVWSCPPSSRVTEFGEIAYSVNEKPPILVSRGKLGDINRRGLQP